LELHGNESVSFKKADKRNKKEIEAITQNPELAQDFGIWLQKQRI